MIICTCPKIGFGPRKGQRVVTSKDCHEHSHTAWKSQYPLCTCKRTIDGTLLSVDPECPAGHQEESILVPQALVDKILEIEDRPSLLAEQFSEAIEDMDRQMSTLSEISFSVIANRPGPEVCPAHSTWGGPVFAGERCWGFGGQKSEGMTMHDLPDSAPFEDTPIVLLQGGPKDGHHAVDNLPDDAPGLRAMVEDRRSRQSRLSWVEWALGLCEAVAKRADCTRRQVGSVILDPEHRVVATGYNGYPAGKPGCASAGACPRGQKSKTEVLPMASYTAPESRCDALHAEENAILYARRDLRGCTIYINHEPCPNCRRVIAGTGIIHMFWSLPGGGFAAEVV